MNPQVRPLKRQKRFQRNGVSPVHTTVCTTDATTD
jgi:hypothetical protein